MSRGFVYTVLIVTTVILFGIAPQVMAGGYKSPDITINQDITVNTYQQAPESAATPLSITHGISDRDLAEGIATALAGGSHQFDFATFDFQASISAAFEPDEEVDAVSFGVAKRWEKVDALFHGGFTRQGSSDFVQVGGTWRF